MAINDRIKEARCRKHMTQGQLADLIGVAKSTVTGYEKGNSEPNIETICKIMAALDVDANFLWQDCCNFPLQVSYAEMEHIKQYRTLDQHGKELVDIILKKQVERCESILISNTIATPPANRLINYYYRLASAGPGQIIFDSPPTKRISIPDTPETQPIDYAIGVNGTSMEPIYHDGDTLLVQMTNTVEIGEIGIFLVNGECFVKERQAAELISLNPNSENIPLNESAQCIGKVIDVLNSECKF